MSVNNEDGVAYCFMEGCRLTMKKEIVVTQIDVNSNKVGIMRVNNVDYISLTDLANYANPDDPSGVIRNWMSNQNSFAFYSLWEELNNPDFNSVESHGIKNNRFTMTPNRWKKDFLLNFIPPQNHTVPGDFFIDNIDTR